MSRALLVVARLRKMAIDDARIELAARLAVEARAVEADRLAQAAIYHEHQTALALGAENAAFAAWLPRGLQARDLARDAATHAQNAAEHSRAALAAVRASGEVVDKMLARLADERQAEATRREQAVFDEIAQRRSEKEALTSPPPLVGFGCEADEGREEGGQRSEISRGNPAPHASTDEQSHS